MAILTSAGETYLAMKQGAGEVANVTHFVYANVPGLDESVQPLKSEGWPSIVDIVDEQEVTSQNFVNPNQVVYSNILTTSMGDYDYNWIGLKAGDGSLLMVMHVSIQSKYKQGANQVGNNQNWNFVVEYTGITELTQINISAESWQLDDTTRMESMDEYSRQNMRDVYGEGAFLSDGFSVYQSGQDHKVKAGVAYIKGLRVELSSDITLALSALPELVYIDAYYEYDALDRVVKFNVLNADVLPSDSVDSLGVRHHYIKIASVAADGLVLDSRVNKMASFEVWNKGNFNPNEQIIKKDGHGLKLHSETTNGSSGIEFSDTVGLSQKGFLTGYHSNDKGVGGFNFDFTSTEDVTGLHVDGNEVYHSENIPIASTDKAGISKLSNDLQSDSETEAASSKAIHDLNKRKMESSVRLIKPFGLLVDAVNDETLSLGDRLSTQDCIKAGDGGGREYLVVGSALPNAQYTKLKNGLYIYDLNISTADLYRQTAGYKLADLDVSSLNLTELRYAQGMAFNSKSNKIFLYLRITGETDKSTERLKIIEFDMGEEGATLTPVTMTDDLTSGHQGFSIEHKSADNVDDIYFWVKAPPHLQDTDDNENTGKHCYRWDYQGAQTSSFQRLRLFPDYGSGLPLQDYFNATPSISTDQKYLVVKVSSVGEFGSDQRIFIYDLSVINSMNLSMWDDPENFNRESAAYVTDWPLSRVQLRPNNYTQAVSCDGVFIYINCGGDGLTPNNKCNVVYTMAGELVNRFDHTLGDPAQENTSGTPMGWEPEGGALKIQGNTELLTLINASYDDGGAEKITHQVWGLRQGGLGSVNRSQAYVAERGSDFHFKGGIPADITFMEENTLKMDVIVNEVTGERRRAFVFQPDGSLELHQPNDPSNGSRVRRAIGEGREILELRANTGRPDGCAVNMYGMNDSVHPNELHVYLKGVSDKPDVIFNNEGELVLNTSATVRLKNDTGESVIGRSKEEGRNYLTIRADETLSKGAGVDIYGDSDPVNPGSIIFHKGANGFFEFENIQETNPDGNGRLWKSAEGLQIT